MGDMSREPSMEDILSSIRRVIARDETPASARQARPAAGDDILDLHPEAAEDTAGAPSAEPVAAEADSESEAGETETVVDEAELISPASADAARQSLDALSAAVAPPPPSPSPAAPASGRTMEDVVVEALRPMLKEWLDANLPPLVEAMVAKEIRRITGRKL
ncbi:MAG: DUF2497 domain-containing protein [Alphaproteobacteria bacterium HGW-Alphaproteobacteria-13]|nr:MAG: DUF2497 domain-containing protein [Alphaproteobacteria bacterium HGW-Alphaproteobacteria-13]